MTLWDIKAVSNYVQDAPFKGGYKNSSGYVYADWCEYHGFSYNHHHYPVSEILPYVPLKLASYTVQIEISRESFEAVYTVYLNGEIYAKARAGDMTNIHFTDLTMISLEC